MIIKIWPIKSDYANAPDKVGGVEGLKNALDYISNQEKVLVKQDELRDMEIMHEGELYEDDTTRVIHYMANEDKIEGKYISGFLCNPENAVAEFNAARSLTLAKAGEERDKETGAVAYHIVQSFPKELNISDEEVHQCGVELCERLGIHQAVICSHVHPAKDELSGEIHGECKHNHILINAYIHPDKLDPKHPKRLKYNDCKETYALLREWNDEIAIEHGLPIIRNPDEERTYSWLENETVNQGLSWKERIRIDIESARRISSNWEEFVTVMEKSGYQIRNTAHVTYSAPDGEHKARGERLGKQYTKENLELYWKIRDYSQKAIKESLKDNDSPPLFNLVRKTEATLSVGIPIGSQGQEKRKLHYLLLDGAKIERSALETYFEPDELYDIFDEDHNAIAAATGREIIFCIGQLTRGERYRPGRDVTPEDEYEEARNKKKYYSNPMFINSRTKRPYRTSLYTEYGRRRTTLELLFILAITVLKKEGDFWTPSDAPAERENEVLYAPCDWKVQEMLDSVAYANAEGIENLGQLECRLQDAGAAYSRARTALKKTTRAKEKMETLNQAIVEFRATRGLSEKIHEMPEGREKEALQGKHKDVISRYKNARAVMYRYQVTEDMQIIDFENRYDKIQKDIAELEERFDEAKEEYRKLKKLSYNASLAENAQYCYGPNYTYERVYEQEELAQKEKQPETTRKKTALDEQIAQRKQNDENEERSELEEIKK